MNDTANVSSAKRSASASSASECPPAHASDGGDCKPHARKVRRVRKSTYAARKEELAVLGGESEVLEAQLKGLQDHHANRLLSESALLNAMLRKVHVEQQLSFATAQSAVSDPSNPLSSYIRLGRDLGERRRTLLGMRKQKLRGAFACGAARSKLLDPLKPQRSDERFEAANGDYCCSQFDLIQFEGVASVKQVFDTLTHY